MKTELRRDVKTSGAILMGLVSIVGTRIFVSIAIASQVAGNGISKNQKDFRFIKEQKLRNYNP